MNTDNTEVINKLRNMLAKEELSLRAMGLYLSLLLGYSDIDFDDPEYKEAFYELIGKRYVEYELK